MPIKVNNKECGNIVHLVGLRGSLRKAAVVCTLGRADSQKEASPRSRNLSDKRGGPSEAPGGFWHGRLFAFLTQGLFIAFLPLPGPPPTASNLKKKEIKSHLTEILVCELSAGKAL